MLIQHQPSLFTSWQGASAYFYTLRINTYPLPFAHGFSLDLHARFILWTILNIPYIAGSLWSMAGNGVHDLLDITHTSHKV